MWFAKVYIWCVVAGRGLIGDMKLHCLLRLDDKHGNLQGKRLLR